MAWPTPPVFAPGDAELDLASLHPGRRPLVAARTRRSSTTGSSAPRVRPSRRRRRSPAGSRSSRPRARASRSRRSRRSSPRRSRGSRKTGPTPAELTRAKTKQEFAVRHRRSRGSAASAARPTVLNQYNTFLGDPGKFEWDMARYRNATPDVVRAGGRRSGSTRATGCSCASAPRESGRAAEAALDRSKEPATRRRPAVPGARGEDGEARQRPRGLRRRAAGAAEGRGHVRHAGRRRGGSRRQGRPRAPDRDAASTWARRPARPWRSRTRSATSGRRSRARPARERAASRFEVLKRNLDPALGDRGRRRAQPAFPASEFDREKKRQLDALAQQDEERQRRRRAACARCSPSARSTRTGGRRRACRRRSRRITREDLAAFHADALEARLLGALIFVGDVTLAEATRARHEALRRLDGRRGRPRSRSRRRRRRPPARSTSSTGRTRRRRDRPQFLPAPEAPDARLLRAHARRRGLGRRRLRHAAEPQPARGQGLLLRRLLGARPVRRRRALVLRGAACRPTRPRSRSSSSTRS